MFADDERFEVVQRLGEGGMGVVYAVHDRQRQETVALKALSRVDARGIYGLKREFRSLADVRHPNIVRLYELGSREQHWYFTMELIAGEPFSRYVRSSGTDRFGPRSFAAEKSLAPPWADAATLEESSRLGRGAGVPFDETKLRRCLAQLVVGVAAIHRAGKLHRDLKPSNVLVTNEGRVVVLDFGLVQDAPTALASDSLTTRNLVVGTPAFMSPEQAAARRAEEASDWYAVGVMLYMSLTGRLPFEGRVRDVLARKQETDAVPPRELVARVPADLDDLCVRLLARNPAARPSSDELHSILGVARPSAAPLPGSVRAGRRTVMVGRAAHLQALEQELFRSREGQPVLVTVTGEAGVGKSLLAHEFLRSAAALGGALTFSARCTEQETMPYRAFDAIVDALSSHLSQQSSVAVESVLPRNISDLLRLFPVLARAGAVEDAPGLPSAQDPGQRRARAFLAFGELLGRIADRRPLVLHVDDPHLADVDSADLLLAVLSQPLPPPLLLLLTYDERRYEGSRFAERIEQLALLEKVHHERLHVGPLPLDESLEVALQTLGTRKDSAWLVAQRVADAAGGNPRTLRQLAALAALRERSTPEGDGSDSLPQSTSGRVALADALSEELSRLEPSARDFLEYLAISEGRVRFDALCDASHAPESGRLALLEGLREREWVALVQAGGHDGVELQQEQVRAAVLASLSPAEVVQRHERLARVLEACDPVEPALIAHHLAAADEPQEAAPLFARAAEAASESLALASAVALYERALRTAPSTEPELRAKWLEALARCQAATGNAMGASQSLLAAADLVGGERARELAREAIAYQADIASLTSMATESFDGGENLFAGIGADDVSALMNGSQVRGYQRGEPIVTPGNDASAFAVVLTGSVDLFAPNAPREAGALVSMSAGSVVGAAPFLLEQAPSTEVRAGQDETRVLALSRRQLDELGARHPHLALQLTLNLARIVCTKLANVRTRALGSRSS